ncbi:Retinoblastoma-binding protein, partial [Coemansia erecta]
MQGHWIYSCPTQAQGDGTGKPNMHRVKRTTGIPKSFLQKVENLDDVGNALVTSDGTLVVATANEAAWNTAQRLARNAITADSDIDPSLVPDELKCRTCQSLVRDATVAPCCQAVFCSTCIERQLLDPGPMHFTCPACRAGLVPDQLEVATETRGKVDEFLRDYSSRQNPTTNDDDDDDKSTENPGADGTPAATNGANSAKSDTASAGAATSTAPAVSTPAVTGPSANNTYIPRPPVQVPPRPRPMGMMPGMMPGMMMGGFPGMPMGQMPFMPGMVPSGMMGQWNGMAPPSAAQAGGPKSDGANSAGYVAPAMDGQTRDGSRGRRDHRSARDSSRTSRDRSRDGRRRGYGRSRERG